MIRPAGACARSTIELPSKSISQALYGMAVAAHAANFSLAHLMGPKMASLKIGLRQAKCLTKMNFDERLEFITDGLPVILDSARTFRDAALELNGHKREAEVLFGFNEEESAKGLILVDMLRCPQKLLPSHVGKMTGWFYNHLARLIYVEACRWKPMHVAQLQEYANLNRLAHYSDGDYGEYIFPNQQLFSRESTLYADIAAYEDGKVFWSSPKESFSVIGIGPVHPPAYDILDALSAVGAFKPDGARIVAEVWGQVDFRDIEGWEEKERLTREMIRRLDASNLIDNRASAEHGRSLYDSWQVPMYNLDLRLIEVSMAELERKREAMGPYGV